MPRIWDEKDNSYVRDSERTSRPGKDRGKGISKSAADGELSGRLKKPFLSSYSFFWIAILLAVILCGGSLYRRLAVEWSHREVAIVVEYRDIAALSRNSGRDAASLYMDLADRGVRGITVAELTGKDLLSGMASMIFGSLASFDPSYRMSLDIPLDRAAIMLDSSNPLLPDMMNFLRVRFPGTIKHVPGKQTLIVLPIAFDESSDSGILPDFNGLEFAKLTGTSVIYRPAPAAGVDGKKAAESLSWLLAKYDSISSVLPLGQIVVGYPEIVPIVKVLKENQITIAQAEFVRQVGASGLFSAMSPEILPLHSLVKEELISRRLSRGQIVERMVRAVHERSIRLILMRPYDLYSVGKLDPFIEDIGRISGSLETRGYTFGWPKPISMFGPSFFAALALALIFCTMFSSYVNRYLGVENKLLSVFEILIFMGLCLLISISLWKVSIVARLLGGVTAALVATEATIWALDHYNKPFDGLFAGLLIIIAGGLVIASFYGSTSSMLRLKPFSGVKLTLLLPPLLILMNDLKRRVHPESLTDIMRRPPLWGELALVGVLCFAALVLTVRSDNFAFVPAWEIRFRDFLERVLWVRPRTKEFLIGYPCLIVYYSLVRGDIAKRYREAFRVGASLAFASAINTFCHFHTLLPLTIVRVVNGWWLGIVVGFVMLVIIDYVGGPIWRKGGRELFR